MKVFNVAAVSAQCTLVKPCLGLLVALHKWLSNTCTHTLMSDIATTEQTSQS